MSSSPKAADRGGADEVELLLGSLGISLETIAARALVLHPEPVGLVVAETGEDGREHLLAPSAAAEIVRAKLERGQSLEEILCVSAPPGYSEHHTGRAVDVTTDGVRPLEIEFEQTAAYGWLARHAQGFGFVLSYPPQNRYGYAYEPWHWCFRQAEA